MKQLKATSILVMLLLSSLVLLVPAPAAAEAGPMDLFTTTDRTVLVELFTGANCPPCVNIDIGLEDFLDDHDRTQVAALLYHENIPTADKLTTQETIDRQNFYWASGYNYAPEFVVDGSYYHLGGISTSAAAKQWFEDQYTTQSANKSQLSIDVDAHIAPSMYGQIWVNVTALETLDYANLYLHVVVVRKHYGPWDGGNGVLDHIYTVRKMLPDANGDPFVVSSGQTETFNYDFDLAKDGDLSDYNDMAVIAFVQTHSRNRISFGNDDRYLAAILQSEYTDVRTIPNVAPVLASGHVEAPARLTQDDDLTFKVFYADPDDHPDTGPSDVMVHFKNTTGQTLQHIMAPVPSADHWTDGRWLKWTTKLNPGIYSYMFTGSDGFDDATGDIGWNATTFEVKPRNKVPQLMDQGYAPLRGDTSTKFRFDIMYRDEDNEQAASAKIYIDAVPHEMTTTSTGPWNDWQVYFLETTLSVGENHKFYFEFSDGIDSHRFPLVTDSPNWFPGPLVDPPNNEPSLTTDLFNPSEGTRMDEFAFTIIYTDGEDDRPQLSYIYIDGTPYIMDGDGGDFSMGVTYRYRTKLGMGPHLVHYLFSDGSNEVRFPLVGELDGPIVTNLAPMAVIATPANNVRFTPTDYISFSAAGSMDPEDDDISYLWTSDIDGQISALQVVDKRLSEGNHTITLTVTDEHGDDHSTTVSVEVRPYEAEPYLLDYIKSPLSPTESDLIRYTVYLNNRGEIPATGLMVSFLVDNTYMASETVTVAVETRVEVRFTWVSLPGEHTVAFEIPGDDITFTEYVVANSVPAVEPTIVNPGDSKGRFKINEEIYFKAGATDGDDDDLTYLWEFGDITTSTQENPSHMYSKAGNYTVMLTIDDTRGGQRVETFEVEIKKPETDTNGGLGSAAMLVGIILVVLVIVVMAVMMMRGRGGRPSEDAPVAEEPRPDVPDYLMPDATPAATPAAPPAAPPATPDGPEYPDYSNGIPEEQPPGGSDDDGYLGY